MKCPTCRSTLPEDAGFCGHCGSALRSEWTCVRCGRSNAPEMRFCLGCGNCGASLKTRCPSCGFENAPGIRFCGECGKSLARSDAERGPPLPLSYTPKHLADRILAERGAMEARGAEGGERKHITALFADIKGLVELMEDLDPEEARAIVDPALRIMMDAVHHYEGYVAQALGDGIFALFGAPIAVEDHARRALYAALRMQEEIRKYSDRVRLETGSALQVRVGVNSGEVVVRSIRKDDLHTDYVPIGHSVNLAARMEALATPGSVAVTESTRRLTDGYFDFRPLGPAQVKGVSEPVAIYEVEGIGPSRTRLEVAASRGLVPFVGRRRHLERLREALEFARAGRGQIVGVVGEPGVGKSRLFHEFRRACAGDWLVLEAFSVSHGKAYPYLPLIDLLKGYFGIVGDDDAEARRRKITARALGLDPNLEETLPYLFALFGVLDPSSPLLQSDSRIRRRRTFEAIKRLLLPEARDRLLILVFEDLQWLDAESEAFLSAFAESIGHSHVLLLVNYRPEYRHGWSARSFFSEARLDPLETESAGEMLQILLGDDPTVLG
ncbi:MAG: AAA family ATPase, partial [Candidatus Binatia bacterium]